MKATHNGHCQCCGRLQALPNGTLSKHGYTVDWGYFNGVCAGADQLPLESSREVLDNVVKSLSRFAAEQDERAAECQNPDTVGRCTITYRDGYQGRRAVYKTVTLTRDEFNSEEHARLRRYGVGWNSVVRSELHRCEVQARNARSHAETMLKLADQIHGQPLQPREDDSKPRRMHESFHAGSLKENRLAANLRRKELEAQGVEKLTMRRDAWGTFNLYYNAK